MNGHVLDDDLGELIGCWRTTIVYVADRRTRTAVIEFRIEDPIALLIVVIIFTCNSPSLIPTTRSTATRTDTQVGLQITACGFGATK